MARNLNSVLVEGEITLGFSDKTEAQFIIRAKADGSDMDVLVKVPVSRLSIWHDKIKVGIVVRIVGHLIPADGGRVLISAEHIEFLKPGSATEA